MKLSAIAAAVALACAFVCSACSTTTTSHLLDNLQGCVRHYDGTVSAGMTGGQFAGTVKVDCQPPQTGTPALTSAPATPAA